MTLAFRQRRNSGNCFPSPTSRCAFADMKHQNTAPRRFATCGELLLCLADEVDGIERQINRHYFFDKIQLEQTTHYRRHLYDLCLVNCLFYKIFNPRLYRRLDAHLRIGPDNRHVHHVRSLTLEPKHLHPSGTFQLDALKLLPSLTNLQVLRVQCDRWISDELLEMVAKHCPQLRELWLIWRLGGPGLEMGFSSKLSVFEAFGNLTSLVIQHIYGDAERCFAAVAGILQRSPKLTELSLSICHYDIPKRDPYPDPFPTLCNRFAENRAVKPLRLKKLFIWTNPKPPAWSAGASSSLLESMATLVDMTHLEFLGHSDLNNLLPGLTPTTVPNLKMLQFIDGDSKTLARWVWALQESSPEFLSQLSIESTDYYGYFTSDLGFTQRPVCSLRTLGIVVCNMDKLCWQLEANRLKHLASAAGRTLQGLVIGLDNDKIGIREVLGRDRDPTWSLNWQRFSETVLDLVECVSKLQVLRELHLTIITVYVCEDKDWNPRPYILDLAAGLAKAQLSLRYLKIGASQGLDMLEIGFRIHRDLDTFSIRGLEELYAKDWTHEYEWLNPEWENRLISTQFDWQHCRR